MSSFLIFIAFILIAALILVFWSMCVISSDADDYYDEVYGEGKNEEQIKRER
jgi:hypothetical protein